VCVVNREKEEKRGRRKKDIEKERSKSRDASAESLQMVTLRNTSPLPTQRSERTKSRERTRSRNRLKAEQSTPKLKSINRESHQKLKMEVDMLKKQNEDLYDSVKKARSMGISLVKSEGRFEGLKKNISKKKNSDQNKAVKMNQGYKYVINKIQTADSFSEINLKKLEDDIKVVRMGAKQIKRQRLQSKTPKGNSMLAHAQSEKNLRFQFP